MNPELSYIQAQCHRQDLLRAAQHEHRLEATRSRRQPAVKHRILNLRIGSSWRVLTLRRAAVGKV